MEEDRNPVQVSVDLIVESTLIDIDEILSIIQHRELDGRMSRKDLQDECSKPEMFTFFTERKDFSPQSRRYLATKT